MAMGSRGRREAEYAIASCRPFSNSTGSMKGTRGATRTLGWLEQHTEARRIRELLSRATYVVWSYGTPIAFVSEDEEGERTAYYVDDHHSVTTSHHQGIARMGMGEYETIGERRPVRRARRQPVRTTEGYGHAPRAQFPSPVMEHPQATEERYQASRRDASADSPGYQNGRTEDQQQCTLQQMLDPRYADPNWTPWGRHGGLPEGADERDEQRVAAEREWRP